MEENHRVGEPVERVDREEAPQEVALQREILPAAQHERSARENEKKRHGGYRGRSGGEGKMKDRLRVNAVVIGINIPVEDDDGKCRRYAYDVQTVYSLSHSFLLRVFGDDRERKISGRECRLRSGSLPKYGAASGSGASSSNIVTYFFENANNGERSGYGRSQ